MRYEHYAYVDAGTDYDAPVSIIQKFVRYPLRGVHERDYAAYVDYCLNYHPGNTSSGSCDLCQWRFASSAEYGHAKQVEAALDGHVRTKQHEKRYAQLVQAQALQVAQLRQDRTQKGELLLERANLWLGLPRWKQQVSDSVRSYIDISFPECFDDDKVKDRWMKATSDLAVYEQMECLSLLELVMITSRLSFIQAENSPEARQTARFMWCVEDIFPLIVEFLGKPAPVVVG